MKTETQQLRLYSGCRKFFTLVYWRWQWLFLRSHGMPASIEQVGTLEIPDEEWKRIVAGESVLTEEQYEELRKAGLSTPASSQNGKLPTVVCPSTRLPPTSPYTS